MSESMIETFATTADVGVRFKGKDYAGLYRNAVKALNLLYFPEGMTPGKAAPVKKYSFDGDSPENIIVNLLTEIVFLLQDRELLTMDVKINTATKTRIDTEFQLVHCTNLPSTEIKSVTYHNLEVLKKNNLLSAEVIFDV